ncbi:hypothetical protein MOE15_00510 [Bacillus atrophaeus]|uniref:hypothetical protein n=1 Tax=Bacillus atrophaeus TaxID=1452 RepID=UPI00227E70F8|nr:hypothetical protein [Bacillus atrophaeus]MCY8807025.1 hypothetical protein [Bacillus atrophaeus]
MSKAVYIGSTPREATSEGREKELKELLIKSKEIQNRLMKMKENEMKNKEKYDAES